MQIHPSRRSALISRSQILRLSNAQDDIKIENEIKSILTAQRDAKPDVEPQSADRGQKITAAFLIPRYFESGSLMRENTYLTKSLIDHKGRDLTPIERPFQHHTMLQILISMSLDRFPLTGPAYCNIPSLAAPPSLGRALICPVAHNRSPGAS
jgi:hypothetical protein